MSNVIVTLKYNAEDDQEKEANMRETFEVILEGIEEKEVERMNEIKESMINFCQLVKDMRIALFNEEQRLFDAVDVFFPQEDLQRYIDRVSVHQDPDKLALLYENKGNNL